MLHVDDVTDDVMVWKSNLTYSVLYYDEMFIKQRSKQTKMVLGD